MLANLVFNLELGKKLLGAFIGNVVSNDRVFGQWLHRAHVAIGVRHGLDSPTRHDGDGGQDPKENNQNPGDDRSRPASFNGGGSR